MKVYRYEDAKCDKGWMLPSDDNYHKQSAGIAHTRTLSFLKPLLNGPYFDLEAVWEEHTRYEFGERDVDKTMATMVDEPYVNHIPTMTYVTPISILLHRTMASLHGIVVLISKQRGRRQSQAKSLLHSPLHLQQPSRHYNLPCLPHRRHRPCYRRIHFQPHAHGPNSLAASRHPAHGPQTLAAVHRRYYYEGRPFVS